MKIPQQMLNYFMRVENEKAATEGVARPDSPFILPNRAPEDPNSMDIGFGHKITDQEKETGMINGMVFFDHGTKQYIPLTYNQAKIILATDLARHQLNARQHLIRNAGWQEGEWNLLPEDGKWLFTGFSFNGALDKFPKMTEAIRTQDYETAMVESKRYWSDPATGKKKPLDKRNVWSETQLAKLVAKGYFSDPQLARAEDANDLDNQV